MPRVFRLLEAVCVAASTLGLAAVPMHAAAPEGYYAGIEGKTGGELKQALHSIIRRDHRYGLEFHTVIPYGSIAQPLREIWRDPAVPENILLAYSSPSVPAFASTWNREHLWPRSRGNTDQLGPDDSDLFHVVPTDSQVNSLRSNRYYDQSDVNDPGYVINVNAAPQISYDSNSWQPAPHERGDIARAMFYMDVRYNGAEPFTTDLDLVSFPPAGPQMGSLNTLLLWHAEDPPDDAERARNDLIYSSYQGNRNPFIDQPELVAAIWGTGIPGDPLNQPLARVSAVSATASESPSSPARFLVSLNQFAGVGGIIVNFSMGGTADRSEYNFTGGDVLSYDPSTGAGTVRVQQGYSTALVDLIPVADGVDEVAETAIVTLQNGAGYAITPDASSFATATLRDSPSLPVYWNFNSSTTTNNVIFANQGVGQVAFSNWTGTTSSFSGLTNNSLALIGRAGNNSWIDFNFSTIGYRNLTLGFWTRGTASGFTNGTWSFSTNGLAFTTLAGVNTATTNTSWSYRAIDFSAFTLLNNASSVTMRYTLSGATSDTGNNRIDELTFGATRMAIGNELREVSVIASVPAALESPETPAVFSVRLNGLSPAGGLTVAFQLAGTATAEDYDVTGAQIWDPTTRTGTVFFPENEDTVFIGIQPVDDGVAEPAETIVLTLPAPSTETYLLGAAAIASATIRDSKSNDNFADAYMLEGLPAATVGDNVGATKEAGEPSHFSSTGTRSVWWRWTAPTSGTLTVSTVGSNFDTILAVYTGNAVNTLTRLASDDDSGGNLTSRVSLTVAAGTTYMIAVDGFSSATGTISLALSALTTPSVSSFSPASGLPGVAVTINGFNFSGASTVRFGGVEAASFTIVSDSQIIAIVPESAVSGVVSVVSSEGAGQSTFWFSVARRSGVASASPDRASVGALVAAQGNVSPSSIFAVSGTSLPGPMTIAAPPGFEVSLDGQTYGDVVEISAPERSDNAANYSAGWTNGANGGVGFTPWNIAVSQGSSGAAGASLGNPQDSGIQDFGAEAFSQFATPASSQAYSWARRGFASAMSVGETTSFRWAVNWDSNTSTGSNYFYAYSGGALLFTVRHGSYPGRIFFSTPNSSSVDTGIVYGDRPMTWTMTLLGENTLRVSATGRDGGEQVVFTRDITVPGAPDAIAWYAYQLDPDIRRRAYFNDLRIESAMPGGGHLPEQTVYVRLAANAPAGELSGALDISSAGQSLASVAVSGAVTETTNSFDTWAQSHGLDPQGNGARGADADGDGHSNLHEFLFGTLPLEATGSLWRHEMEGSDLVLTFVGRETGATYKLMSTGNLASGTWEEIPTTVSTDQEGVPAGHERRQVVVPKPSGNRFFRLQAAEVQ